jgi:hypothetical protein
VEARPSNVKRTKILDHRKGGFGMHEGGKSAKSVPPRHGVGSAVVCDHAARKFQRSTTSVEQTQDVSDSLRCSLTFLSAARELKANFRGKVMEGGLQLEQLIKPWLINFNGALPVYSDG